MPRIPRPTPPRGLIFLASAWLMISWVLTIGIRPPVQMHAASYTPSVRMLLLSIALGIGIAWPLVRLSGSLRAWPIRQALLDLVVLLCLAQVVIWPLRLVTTWPPLRSAAIDLCLVGWSVAIAALIALGTIPARSGIGVLRAATMLAIVIVVAGAPFVTMLSHDAVPFAARPPGGADGAWWAVAGLSPITAIDALCSGGPTEPQPDEWRAALRGWWVALALWTLGVLLRPFIPRMSEDEGERGTA
jgi:hypothetical protein